MEHIKTERSVLVTMPFENRELLDRCVAEAEPQLKVRPEIIVYGRKCSQNRNVGFFSDESVGYYYSGKLMGSVPLTNHLKELLLFINTSFGSNFNGILVNQYCSGNDYISAHSDDERGLGIDGVVSVSYGATRKFRIRNKKDKKIVMDIPLVSYGIVHMGGDFQKEFTHEIPVEKKIKDTRVSFTFRHHKQ